MILMKRSPEKKSLNPRSAKKARISPTQEDSVTLDSDNMPGPIAQLPNELLVEIFGYVRDSNQIISPRLREVCHNWNAVHNYMVSQQMNREMGPVTLYRAEGLLNQFLGRKQATQHRITSSKGRIALFEAQQRKIDRFNQNIEQILIRTNNDDAVIAAYIKLRDMPRGNHTRLLLAREKAISSLNEMIIRQRIGTHRGTHLDCIGCYLTDFPEQLIADPDLADYWHKLTYLDLFFNNLTKLPDNIGDLAKLTHLNLPFNQLNRLPDSLGELQSLIYLSLDSNKFSRLPDTICNLRNLKNLSLDKNVLTDIPIGIERLKTLRTLSMSGNSLTMLPECLENLPKLEELRVDNNLLRSIPDRLEKLLKGTTREAVLAAQCYTLKERLTNLFVF